MRWLVLTLALLLLCACGGVEPPGRSTEEFAPNTGANEIIDNMMLRNAFMIGGAAGRPLTPGANAPLYLTLVNERGQTDELVSLTAAPLFSGATVSGEELVVRPGELVGGGPAPQAVLTGLTRSLRSGSYIPIRFVFRDAGTLEKRVPVLPPSDWRATFSPAPQMAGGSGRNSG